MKEIPTFVLQQQEAIQQLCSKCCVIELKLFGSAVSDQFDLENSDLDFYVEFANPDSSGIADRFFTLADGLENLFKRPVDLITKPSVKNRIFLENLQSNTQTLYAA